MPGQSLLHEQVARAVGDGADLHEVEDAVLRPAPLSPELHDALWLYAWGLRERQGEGSDLPSPAVPRA